MKKILVLFLMLSVLILCGCEQMAGQNSAGDNIAESSKPIAAPEETPFVRPSPKVLNLEGKYALRGMSRDGEDEADVISQFRVLGMEPSLSVNETNAGSFLFMNRTSQVDFHVLDGTVTVTDPTGNTREIEYRAYDETIEFEWQGDLLRFEKNEQMVNE